MIQAGARSVAIALVAVIAVVLVIFLVITALQGDPTNNLEENQPSPSPARSSPS